MRDADRAEPEVGVAQHHALGPARSSRKCRARPRARSGPGPTVAEPRRPSAHSSSAIARASALVRGLERSQPRLVGDQQLRAAVGEDVRGLGALEHRIDRDMDQPRPRCRQRQDASELRLAHPARDAIARVEPLRTQGCRGPADLLFELGVGQRLLAYDQRRSVRRAPAASRSSGKGVGSGVTRDVIACASAPKQCCCRNNARRLGPRAC